MTTSATPVSPADEPKSRRSLRWPLWVALVLLLLVMLALLLHMTLRYEEAKAQDRTDAVASTAAIEMQHVLQAAEHQIMPLTWSDVEGEDWARQARDLIVHQHGLLNLERRDLDLRLQQTQSDPSGRALFANFPRAELEVDLPAACQAARRSASPAFSRTYFVPKGDGTGIEVVDLCIPETRQALAYGYLVATLGLGALLDDTLRQAEIREVELSLIEADGTRLVRAGPWRGVGVYKATRLVDLPGASLQLHADSTQERPGLIPNLAIALVLGLSLVLLGLVAWLAHDMRRRARAEAGLAEALSFRRAMEDSLVTGLRARDSQGRVTYVNPAFCAMVGFAAEEMIGKVPPPYWPPEHIEEYRRRQSDRLRLPLDGTVHREGFESEFMRKNGERFPVMIYEAPLYDSQGQHAGWMSAALDVSGERRMEELSRQQQERLQATARLATVGEMASLLSHELNQPLAAIASYATGSLNLMADADQGHASDEELRPLLKQALTRIAEQAERAGRVIKSVHGFVRRRDAAREVLAVDQLVEAVLPLVRLQARKSGTRIEVDLPKPLPRVLADRTMVEQILLNLTRNAIQAMETDTPLPDRVLTLRVRQKHPRWVEFSVIDAGPGIAPEVAEKLFTPFFTTRTEGMGLGLSMCRTVVEQHGGELIHGPAPVRTGASEGESMQHRGTEFRFTLPAPESHRRSLSPES